MSWLEDLLGQSSGAIPGGGFQWDESQQAELARQEAAKRLARVRERPFQRPAGMEGQEAIPFSAGMLSPMGMNWPGASSPNPPTTPAVAQTAPDMPPSTNDPMSREPVLFKDGVPLPRPKPAGIGGDEGSPMSLAPPEDNMLPPNATSTVGTAAPVIPGGGVVPGANTPSTGGGILGKIFDPANAPLLLAMGGGFAGAPSFGTGMRRGFSAAAPQAALLRKEQLGLDYQNQTVKALIAKGIPLDMAQAAATNPEILKQLIPQAFGAKQRKFTQIGEGLGGDKQYGFVDEASGKVYGMDGKEIGTGGTAALPSASGGMLAKGVAQYDPQLHGEDYFNQFGPEVQSAIKAYMRGDTQPTGNPRLKGFETKVKEWARKYGDDIGVPVSDALFSERRKYRTELGSNQAGTAGGQGKAFVQGIEHADALATQLEKLGNWGGFGIPALASAANMTREALSTKQAGIAAEAASIGQTLAGEVGKLFSGSSGGGVHEREETRKRFNTVKSGPELAGALQGTLETMEGGLRALEKRRNDVLGPKNDVEFMTPETEAKIGRIKEVIARLRGESAAKPAQVSAPNTPRLGTGQETTINGVTIKRLD